MKKKKPFGVIDKYLMQYAEPEVLALKNFPTNVNYQYSLVIPAYQESIDFILRFFKSRLSTENVLLIVVINQPDSDVNTEPQQTLFNTAKNLGVSVELAETIVHVSIGNANSGLLLVNRFSQAIPHKKGVGLARKIGCDIACALNHQGIIVSDFIASSDADAYLPANYFTQQTFLVSDESNALPYSAACYNFSHIADKQLDQNQTRDEIYHATQQYEQALRYYVDGLRYAMSPYAFFTIGSILLFNTTAYANVRGFPKKSAGEDFYLLNKLAKIGRIAHFEDSTIELTARLSDRVPFGTGPAVEKIIALAQQGEEYCYYHPGVFHELKQLNIKIEQFFKESRSIEQWLALLPLLCQQALQAIGFEKFAQQHRHNSMAQLNKQWLVWFDAFKTLKFIHAVRDIEYANIPLTQALLTKDF